MIKHLLILTSISGAIAIIAGAFGAHSLKAQLSEALLNTFKTGVYYQLFHTVALLALIALMQSTPLLARRLSLIALLWLLGIVLFSGSLYWLALGGPSWLGPLTPIGGLLLIGGWLNIVVCALKINTSQP